VFTDWKGKRRRVPLGSDLETAKAGLKLRLADDIKKVDFDLEKRRGMTLFSWIERFMQVKASKRSLSKDRESAAKIKAYFGDCALETITSSMIEGHKQKRLTEKTRHGRIPKPATINREVAFLRSLLNLAARDRLIDQIPYIELFEENNERDRTATPEELESLLANSGQHLI
jgi:hypothetical protein